MRGLAFGFIALICAPVFADVVIVKTSDAEPYKAAEQTLHDRLAGPNVTVRSVLVQQLADNGISATISTTDTVVAIGTPAASWLHNQLPEGIDLVYCMVSHADQAGLLKGAPCWGVTTDVPVADQIKLISEALPHAKSIGMLYRSDTPAGRDALQSLKDALPHDWHLEAIAVDAHASVAEAIDELMKKDVDLIWTASDPKLFDAATVRALLLASMRSNIPVWGFSPAFVRAGAMLGAGVDPKAQADQAADLVQQLKQKKAGDADRAAVPREIQIALNLNVAEQLKIELPDALVKRATYVYRGDK